MKDLEVVEASLVVQDVTNPILGLVISASVVATFSSEISILPSFVNYSLYVGIVCPNCHGHTVPIIGLQILGLVR